MEVKRTAVLPNGALRTSRIALVGVDEINPYKSIC
jgi:hypothetical protein